MTQLLIYKAKLLNVEQNGVDDKGEPKMRLIFSAQRYDKGLEQMVPFSQPIKVLPEHQHMKDFYLSFKGREIYLPVELSTQMNGMSIFYKTTGDGKVLMLQEKKLPEQEKQTA